MTRPRKDYGCPLRIYAYPGAAHPATHTILPPRSLHTFTHWRDAASRWQCLSATDDVMITSQATVGPHLGQRIHWAELPPAVQAAVRASFLGEYCPPA